MNRIAELRKAKGFSQVELAEQLHIAQNTLSQYENGVRRPTSNIVMKLSEILEATPNCVLGLPEVDEKDSKSGHAAISDVREILILEAVEDVNLYLSIGWRLLHIGEVANFGYDREGSSKIVYTMGWFGDVKDTLREKPEARGNEKFELW